MSAIDLFQQLWPALYVIGALAFGWGMWQLSRYFVPRSEHTKLVDELPCLSGQVSKLSDRVGELETQTRSLPDNKTMHTIQLSLEELRGSVKAQDAKIDGMVDRFDALANNVEMLIEHHLRDS